jgi:hypothetical protein
MTAKKKAVDLKPEPSGYSFGASQTGVKRGSNTKDVLVTAKQEELGDLDVPAEEAEGINGGTWHQSVVEGMLGVVARPKPPVEGGS